LFNPRYGGRLRAARRTLAATTSGWSVVAEVARWPTLQRNGHNDDAESEYRHSQKFKYQCVQGNIPHKPEDLRVRR
jgi:hypothetical protein